MTFTGHLDRMRVKYEQASSERITMKINERYT